MRRRKLFVTALIGAGLVGAAGIDEFRTAGAADARLLAATLSAPACGPTRAGPQYKTFFRLALAETDNQAKPLPTEVAPFSRVVRDAASSTAAAAKPMLADDLGKLHFPVTTSVPLAQQFFDQGLRLSYAFNHAEAARAFRHAHALDPECAMCFWGEALVLGPNINAPMDAAAIAPAYAAVSRAVALADKASEKERALIAALAKRYAPPPSGARAELDRSYAEAMAPLAARFPDDHDITLLYAESLMDLQPWNYWETGGFTPIGRTAEILDLLEKVLQAAPEHPGAIHFYIHMTESSSDPSRALPHAKRLGRLMPGAGHIVHMPFHTYFRVGMYKEAVEANRRAVRADEAYIARAAPVGLYPQAYYPHNVHSLMASAQMAGDGRTVIAAAAKLDQIVSPAAAKNIAWVQPIKAAPYFAHAQFSDATTVLGLPDPGPGLPYVQAMWHYARGAVLSRAGDVAAAQREVDAIDRIERSTDFADLSAGGVPANAVLRLAAEVVRGRIARAGKDAAAAVRHFEAAVALEDSLAYTEPPFWYYPTRQSLGAALLDAGELEQAETVLRSSLARAPNNGWALFGLMKVYEQRGDRAGARVMRGLLDKAWLGDLSLLDLSRL